MKSSKALAALLVLVCGLCAALSARAVEAPAWDWGLEATTITQTAPSFDAPYAGPKSFLNDGSENAKTTFPTTLFFGARLWKGAWVSVQPEFSGGSGVGGGQGIAGFPNQDVLRVPSIGGKPYVARLFVQQTISLGEPAPGEPEAPAKPEEKFSPGGAHLYAATGSRLEITFGKIALPDIFDGNSVSGEAHHRLMNWALVNNGAWDFAADTRGYTWGLALALEGGPLAVRAGAFAMPEVANGVELDHQFREAHAENLEVEWDFDPARAGAVRFLSYVNHARMGNYDASLAAAAATGTVPDITATREAGRTKYGFGLNAERKVGGDVSLFTRASWNDGANESFAYTEIDRTLSVGASHTGSSWGRPNDVLVGAVVANGLSDPHRRYLEAGGFGFQIGDGKLNYGLEWVAELDYAAHLTDGVSLGLDVQYVLDPGYNKDRGPIAVYGLRVHVHR